MNDIITPEAAQKRLVSEIVKSHNHLGYNAVDWFNWMIDDCLAGFGKKIKTPWTEEQNKHLFELGKYYAEAVIKQPYHDVLGAVYQELSSNYGKKALGQYFTPFSVASMMSKISYTSDLFEDKPVVRICEPCGGSGVMVLAFLNTLVEEGPELPRRLSITCVDLDMVCVKMCTLQIMANNLIHQTQLGELITLRGNTLGDPKGLDSFYHVSTPDFDALAKEESEKVIINVVQEEEKEIEIVFPTPKKQLNIMDFLQN